MTSIECANPCIGDATYIYNHKELLKRLQKTSIRLETWLLKESMCGGYFYRLTAPDSSALTQVKQIIQEMGFPQDSFFEKGKLVELTDTKAEEIW